MEDKSPKVLDGAELNLKRKQSTQSVAQIIEVSTPSNLAVKQMILVGDDSQPTDSGPVISKSLVKYFLNYKKSGLLKRLMFYKNGEWSDYPEDVVNLVKTNFEIKKAAVEIELNGHNVVLNFLHMYNVNLQTGSQQPIAWIDEAGSCFFPELFAGSDDEPNNLGEKEGEESYSSKEAHELKFHLSMEINGGDESKMGEFSGDSNALFKDIEIDDQDSTNKVANENFGETSNQDIEIDLNAYIEPVYGRQDVDSVKKLFLTGMATFGISEGNIMDVYRNSGILMQAQLQLFQKQADITKEIHSDANVRYGWLACSKVELTIMMEYGLGHNALSSCKCIYGFGVHLAVVTHPYACAPYCDIDENGVRHLVLCRVIMGNMEPLSRDNNQIRPNSFKYDNGVDDIQHPKYYMVWNMNMNTHIYPEFVVSFKESLNVEACLKESKKNVYRNNCSTLDTVNVASVPNTRRVPRSPWLPFPMLLAAIKHMVSPKAMLLIKAHYTQLMEKKISHDDFVMKLRLIVGDTILRSVVTNLQDKGPSSDNLDDVTENS